jgi:enediyne biosynthesis protein E4
MKNIRFIVIIAILIIIIIIKNSFYSQTVVKEIKRNLNYYLSITNIVRDDIDIDFVHKFKEVDTSLFKRKTSPWLASATIDIDNSGEELIFLGGANEQDDVLLKYDAKENKMKNVIQNTNLSSTDATYAAVAVDFDKDGYVDLIVARQTGVFLYKNNNGIFTKKTLIKENKKSFPIAISVADYNKDKHLDIYVSKFINPVYMKAFTFNNPKHAQPNILLQGDKDGNFKDVTKQTNSAGLQNTFTSTFVDLDKDGYPDLVIAPDTGEVEIYKNNNGKHFTRKKVDSGYGFWMGIGVGDIDNDGDQDLYMTNLGNTVARTKMFRGDLKPSQRLNYDHILLRNDGDFNLKDVTKKQNAQDYPFGWGAVFEDINLDTKQDLLFSTNYIDYPPHKVLKDDTVVLLNKGGKFNRIKKYSNRAYSQNPLLVDINKDGIKDILWININGPPKIYINKNDDDNNYFNVKLPNNVNFLNAQIEIIAGKTKQTKENIRGGVGFGSDQSKIISFGIGKDDKIKKLTITTIYGNVYTYNNLDANQTFFVKEKHTNKILSSHKIKPVIRKYDYNKRMNIRY